ncbi:hypothetical protein HMPREF1986_02501 [Oribacterium sp. oral taxon 078 str. F0263]|nr:hypothetical protein HMPREF1986_02501 [Oribacterium sp. oral taxon 078 str. F0263]
MTPNREALGRKTACSQVGKAADPAEISRENPSPQRKNCAPSFL